MFKDLAALCAFFLQKSTDEELELIEDHLQQRNEGSDDQLAMHENMALMMMKNPEHAILATKNHMDEGISLMEKAAKKIHPIIKEV